ncbi:MAG: Galactose-1-phosphate uridylyltransferase [Parcubacteria group bacterium GW2011_GWA2_47_10]|nr:MAG: Galactose-1-phosphate uridylyltransferase [Parcubacteria group bacterium GW2011_GWA2_47_10]
MKNISELRQDIVSGDWVVIATGRGRRPDDFAKQTKPSKPTGIDTCPFEGLADNALYVSLKNSEIHSISKKSYSLLRRDWFLQIIPNKYPAFGKGLCSVVRKNGPYFEEDGVGFHDVVVTRDHNRSIALMKTEEVAMLIRAYRDRYLQLKDSDCVEYVSIFHNHGPEAGASIAHPHSQVVAIPVVPPTIRRSVDGSEKFYKKNKKCVHCVMVDFERKERERIVYENELFIAFAPYASRTAFEIRIFPKKHSALFETIHNSAVKDFADALRVSLLKLYKGLGNPSYNFFIHTSPAFDSRTFDHYHWHVEIFPKTGIWAGFELGTGIDISTVAPEKAAAFLRKIK